MGNSPMVGAYIWSGDLNWALQHLEEIATAVTAIRQNPKAAETKLSEIGTHVLTAAFAIIRMNDIATEEVKRLRRKVKKQGGEE